MTSTVADSMFSYSYLWIPIMVIVVPILLIFLAFEADTRDMEYTNMWLEEIASCGDLKQYILQDYDDTRLYYLQGKAEFQYEWRCER